MSEQGELRENEVPQGENPVHPLNEREPVNEGGMGEWTYAMWIDPQRQGKLEAFLRDLGVDYTCQRLVF